MLSDKSFVVPMCGKNSSQNGNLAYRYSLYPGWISSRRFLRQMQKDNIDFSLIQQELNQLEVKTAKGRFKSKLMKMMRGPVIQLLLCSLVLIDALIVTAEIILEIHAVKAEKKTLEYELVHKKQENSNYYCTNQKDPLSAFNEINMKTCCLESIIQNTTSSSSIMFYPLLIDGLKFGFSTCCLAKPMTACSLNISTLHSVYMNSGVLKRDTDEHCSKLSCCMEEIARYLMNPTDSHGHTGNCHFFHTIACILHFISMGILCIFIIQLFMKMYCMGKHFFKLKFEVVDGFIIIISLIADVIFVYVASDEISLIIVFLLWRIVRVINSLLMHGKQRDEFRIQLQKRARRISELKVEALNARRIFYEKHIEVLEALCLDLGLPREQLLFCRPTMAKAGKEVTKNALRSMAFLTSEMITQFAVGPMPSNSTPKLSSQLADVQDSNPDSPWQRKAKR